MSEHQSNKKITPTCYTVNVLHFGYYRYDTTIDSSNKLYWGNYFLHKSRRFSSGTVYFYTLNQSHVILLDKTWNVFVISNLIIVKNNRMTECVNNWVEKWLIFKKISADRSTADNQNSRVSSLSHRCWHESAANNRWHINKLFMLNRESITCYSTICFKTINF